MVEQIPMVKKRILNPCPGSNPIFILLPHNLQVFSTNTALEVVEILKVPNTDLQDLRHQSLELTNLYVLSILPLDGLGQLIVKPKFGALLFEANSGVSPQGLGQTLVGRPACRVGEIVLPEALGVDVRILEEMVERDVVQREAALRNHHLELLWGGFLSRLLLVPRGDASEGLFFQTVTHLTCYVRPHQLDGASCLGFC